MEAKNNVEFICPECGQERTADFQKKHPNLAEIAKKNDFVKILFSDTDKTTGEPINEWMWVKLKGISGGSFSGTLASEPLYMKSIRFGDIVLGDFDKVCDYLHKSGKKLEQP